MNIYDEAKVITHEEARKELEYFQQCVGLKLNKVNDYINQQEKKDERAKKVEEELKYTKEQFDKYWKEVCILKPRLAKVEELLGLYRLEKEAKEKYHTSGSLYVMQHVLDELREIAEEINLKEKELEEKKK